MRTLKYLILLYLTLSLLGCYWPPPSKGGYAAHYLFNPVRFSCSGPYGLCHINRQRLARCLYELNRLRYTQSVKCFPARDRELRLLGQQIAQEIAAQLYVSAQLDLHLFEVNLRSLNYLNTLNGCPRIKYDKEWELLKLRIQ